MRTLAALAATLWIQCVAYGDTLAVLNPGFESHIIAPGVATTFGTGLDHWTAGPGEAVGISNISDLVDFPEGTRDGVNVAYSQGAAISQLLSHTVIPGITYALSVKVGNHPCCAFTGYGIQLVAADVVLAEDTSFISVRPGSFETAFVSYTSPESDPLAGEPLEIRLLSLGPQVAFDDVRLSSSSAVYPDWEMLNQDQASSRGGAIMTYDSAREVAVTFGGWTDSVNGETLEFDTNCNTWRPVFAEHAPPARIWYAMAYDSLQERTILFGGFDPSNNTHFNDTWAYDGTDWQQIPTVHSPPARATRAMVYDSNRDRLVLFGGEHNGPVLDDTWEFDGTDWAEVTTPASPPAAGALVAMAFDENRQRSVLTIDDGTTRIGTWEYDGSNWTEIVSTDYPFGRWGHSMAYDSQSQAIVLFGGVSNYIDTGSALNDTWAFDGTDWSRIVTRNTPFNAEQHAMTFDTANERILVLNFGNTWALSRQQLETPCEPPGVLRVHPHAVYLRDGKTSEQLRLEIRDGQSRPRNPADFTIQFTSTNPDLVQVSPTGLITSTGYGHAQIEVVVAEMGFWANVPVQAGHLRSMPFMQYLSLDGHETGQVWPDIGNADGTPVDLTGRSVEYMCSGCKPGQPLQVDGLGQVVAVDVIEEEDPAPLSVTVVVDGAWPQSDALLYVSETGLGLSLMDYSSPNTNLTSPMNMDGVDLHGLITDMRTAEIFEFAFKAQREITGGVWGGGGKQALVHYLSPSSGEGGRYPGCGGSGNPIRLGTDYDEPEFSCFVQRLPSGDLTPRWGFFFHEMGHNFTWTDSRFADFADAGNGFDYSEGFATAVGMYTAASLLEASDELGLSPELEYSIVEAGQWPHWLAGTVLAAYVDDGANYAEDFTADIVDEILWVLAHEHNWGVLYRMYSALLPRGIGPFPFPMETMEQQATFFALVMSEATKTDLKERFRVDWGFPIDDSAWDLMQPLVSKWVAHRDPASYAGSDKIVNFDETIHLDDAYVFDPEGDDLQIRWQIVEKPPGSQASIANPSALQTTLTVNSLGTYTLSLSAADRWIEGAADLVRVTVEDSGRIFKNGFE